MALAVALFAINAAYGHWRISAPATASERVALIDSNDTVGPHQKPDERPELAAVQSYATQIERLRGKQVRLIVLPESISRLDSPWRSLAEARLAAAADATGATVVAGFATSVDGAARNVALAFRPGIGTPTVYEKRHLVKPGAGPVVLPDGTGLEICLDMDYQRMLRHDERTTRPKLLAVPAWDFGADAWFHARDAVMRSVENGVPMARSARDGLLTLNDRFGRCLRVAHGRRIHDSGRRVAARGQRRCDPVRSDRRCVRVALLRARAGARGSIVVAAQRWRWPGAGLDWPPTGSLRFFAAHLR